MVGPSCIINLVAYFCKDTGNPLAPFPLFFCGAIFVSLLLLGFAIFKAPIAFRFMGRLFSAVRHVYRHNCASL